MKFIFIIGVGLTLIFQTNGFSLIQQHDKNKENETDIISSEVGLIETDSSENAVDYVNSCSNVSYPNPDVDTASMYSAFNFNASWISRKYFWLSNDFNFESRYVHYVESLRRKRDLIKVFVLPHSHNDPGWLETYEQYYLIASKHTLDNAVQKLTELPFMTFIWSETTYLAKWWEEANSLAKTRFLKLIEEGRLEIGTGGWVVPDEATPSLYALINELTEGQQWIKNYLNLTAQYSWAIDPFGHSSTHSHLLHSSGIRGMVIQRLHYAWKHWLAEHKATEFTWRPRWDTSGSSDIKCLSLPFDLYSIKHACGPEPNVCLKFDFRRIAYEYGENNGLMTPINNRNVRKLSEEIVAQYHKTASLTKNNVILVPLGDDFRYNYEREWDQQYVNYMQLFSYINSRRDQYRMDIRFGTIRDYYEAVSGREESKDDKRPVLSGDFYPYSDVYVSGRPSYWTGFYGTRPYWKKFHRELENELRSAEMLFTFANTIARESNSIVQIKTLANLYLDLVKARQEFAVFTHHDGITGTARHWVMMDYGRSLHRAYQDCINLQIQSIKIIHKHVTKRSLPIITSDFIRERFDLLKKKITLEVFNQDELYTTKVLVFNNLGWTRTELIKVLVKVPTVEVVDSKGTIILSQINPVFNLNDKDGTLDISKRMFEVAFLADLEPLGISTFQIRNVEGMDLPSTTWAKIYCKSVSNFNQSEYPFLLDEHLEDPVEIENSDNLVKFQNNGLIDKVLMKSTNLTVPIMLTYGMYKPKDRQSGAYLLKPEMNTEWRFFRTSEHFSPHIIKITGPIMSQVVSIHSGRDETIKVRTSLLHSPRFTEGHNVMKGIYLENQVDFSQDFTNRVEAFMRFDTSLNSSIDLTSEPNATEDVQNRSEDRPIIYTDQNGFVSERRIFTNLTGYEGNTYPVTNVAFIQDEKRKLRFSILVDRTHGFNSVKNGRMETLIERKTLYDDGRGLSEGVTDAKKTISNYILLLEDFKADLRNDNETHNQSNNENMTQANNPFCSWQPTISALETGLRLNYPPNIYVFNEPNDLNDTKSEEEVSMEIALISTPLPKHVHLVNFRTLSEQTVSPMDSKYEVPGKVALLNLQSFLRGEGQCLENCSILGNRTEIETFFQANYINVTNIIETSLTGAIDKTLTHNSSITVNRLLHNFKLFLS